MRHNHIYTMPVHRLRQDMRLNNYLQEVNPHLTHKMWKQKKIEIRKQSLQKKELYHQYSYIHRFLNNVFNNISSVSGLVPSALARVAIMIRLYSPKFVTPVFCIVPIISPLLISPELFENLISP